MQERLRKEQTLSRALVLEAGGGRHGGHAGKPRVVRVQEMGVTAVLSHGCYCGFQKTGKTGQGEQLRTG